MVQVCDSPQSSLMQETNHLLTDCPFQLTRWQSRSYAASALRFETILAHVDAARITRGDLQLKASVSHQVRLV